MTDYDKAKDKLLAGPMIGTGKRPLKLEIRAYDNEDGTPGEPKFVIARVQHRKDKVDIDVAPGRLTLDEGVWIAKAMKDLRAKLKS